MDYIEQKIEEFKKLIQSTISDGYLLMHSCRKPKRFYIKPYNLGVNKLQFRIKSLRKKL